MLAHLPFDASLPVIQEVSSLPHQNISYNFVDVSESQGAFCWKYFLLDKTHFKAKCNVMKNNGKICNQIIATPNSGTKTCNRHLKNPPSLSFVYVYCESPPNKSRIFWTFQTLTARLS